MNYTGYTDVAIKEDGSWISPASAGSGLVTLDVFVWDGDDYRNDAHETVEEFIAGMVEANT